MRVVSYKAIRVFGEEHPEARNALDRWYKVAKRATWANFVDVRQSFNTADFVAPHIVFDIGGNKYRLIAEINFRRRVLFIRSRRQVDAGQQGRCPGPDVFMAPPHSGVLSRYRRQVRGPSWSLYSNPFPHLTTGPQFPILRS